ncbi:hypothetical protein Tco_0779265 [Tanacetum coccineum]
MNAAIRNQGALIKTLEIQIGQMSKVLQESGFGSLPSSTETNSRDHVKSIFTNKHIHIPVTTYWISPIRRIHWTEPYTHVRDKTNDDFISKSFEWLLLSLDPFLEDYIELNDLNEPFEIRRNQGDDLMPTIEEGKFKKFHNSIMKDKIVYKGDNVVGALMNAPIFVRTFSVVTDFAVLEDMDAYHDEGMGDVNCLATVLKEVRIKVKTVCE